MKKISFIDVVLFFSAFATLNIELSLIKIYDILFYPQFSYICVSLAFLGFAIGCVPHFFVRIRNYPVEKKYGALFLASAISLSFLILLIKNVNLNVLDISQGVLRTKVILIFLFLLSTLPFVFLGHIIAQIFIDKKETSTRMYVIDMLGAAMAALLFPFFLPLVGAETWLLIGALILVAFVFYYAALKKNKAMLIATFLTTQLAAITIYLFANQVTLAFVPKWFTINQLNFVERSYWDPMGRIDVVSHPNENRKHVFYDAGSIGTKIFSFNGDYTELKKQFLNDPDCCFTRLGALASHFLKDGTNSSVFQIGVGAGQETKGALMFGASKVVGVDVNKRILDLIKGPYAEYAGHIYQDPRVSVFHADGRAFLDHEIETFDIIQIFSTYAQTSAFSGKGALEANYLYTVEAIEKYLSHLKSDGILHINLRVPIRLISIIEAAWKNLNLTEFWRHLVIVQSNGDPFLPTIMVKLTPWNENEIDELKSLFNLPAKDQHYFLYHPFFIGPLSSVQSEVIHGFRTQNTIQGFPINLIPATDDMPFYYNFTNNMFQSENNVVNLKNDMLGTIEGNIKNQPALFKVNQWITYFSVPLIFSVFLLSIGKIKKCRQYIVTNLYFSSIGFGFIGFQYILLYQLIRLFDSPPHGTALILGSMLILQSFGGKLLTGYLTQTSRVFFLFLFILSYSFALYYLFPPLLSYSTQFNNSFIRAMIALVTLAPLALAMGPLFPFGLRNLSNADNNDPELFIRNWIANSATIGFSGFIVLAMFLNYGFSQALIFTLSSYAFAFILILIKKPKTT